MSKIVGSATQAGQASGLNCTWTEDAVTDGKQSCTFKDSKGELRHIRALRASFVIDTLTYSGALPPRCAKGQCRFTGPHEVSCFVLGATRKGLQCKIQADRLALDTGRHQE